MTNQQPASSAWNTQKVSHRFFITLGAQASKSVFSFLASMIVARGLGPVEYGNLAFLLGSFAGLRLLLDMGTGQAFFTLAARQQRSRHFYAIYAAWLLVGQILLPLLFILVILPRDVVSLLWQDQARERVWLAFLASTLQYLFWPQLIQLGEVVRRTQISQSLTIAVTLAQLAIVATLYSIGTLTVVNFLAVTISAFFLGGVLAFLLLPRPWKSDAPEDRTGVVVGEFATLCKPMAICYLLQAIQGWAEVWLIQHYSGPRQQGYYALGMQISLVGLLATTSLQNIFWREVAAMEAQGLEQQVHDTYRLTSRLLLFTAAVPVAFLIFWVAPIVHLALGDEYRNATAAVAVLFLYPLTQCLTTPVFALLYAMRRVDVLAGVGSAIACLNILASYLVLAPAIGLSAGALGMGARIVLLATLNVLVLEWWVHRKRGWHHDWAHRIRLLGVLLMLAVAGRLAGLVSAMFMSSLLSLAAGGAVYMALVAAVFYRFPDWAGVSAETRDRYISRAREIVLRRL